VAVPGEGTTTTTTTTKEEDMTVMVREFLQLDYPDGGDCRYIARKHAKQEDWLRFILVLQLEWEDSESKDDTELTTEMSLYASKFDDEDGMLAAMNEPRLKRENAPRYYSARAAEATT
jgi:hypothetical protein